MGLPMKAFLLVLFALVLSACSPDKLQTMSDPGAPSYSVPTFASETDYPVGSDPWSSQPMKVAPADDFFTPGVTQPAENMNYVLNAKDVSAAAAKTYLTNLRTYVNVNKLIHVFNQNGSDASDALSTLATFATTSYTGGTLVSLSVADSTYAPVAGDIIEVTFTAQYQFINFGGSGGSTVVGFVKLAEGATPTDIPGAKAVHASGDTNVHIVSATIHGSYVHAGGTNVISILGKLSTSSGSPTVEMVGPFSLRVHVYRTTP